MPSKKIVGQFTRSDLFSVLPTGFYVFMVVYSCVILESPTGNSLGTLWSVLSLLALRLQEQPVLLIFLLFACYLLGSIFRALPVRWAENTIPPFTTQFPNPEVIRNVIEALNDHAELTKHDKKNIPNVEKTVPIDVFNYWKNVLCVNTVEGFEYYQSFETRVRLFAGIIWAAWCGMLASIFIFVRSGNILHGVGIPLFAISFILIIFFGSNFRRVRCQEVKALITIFTALLQKNTLGKTQPGGTIDQDHNGPIEK